ncbi:hypothetical protein FACHB389_11115 [Nostoc calcicola FACHB-389]|nr:hypothetical protein [Nostoc calcicola FACHB-3891]MDZ8062888.1 hypothetical protein [Nostoc sp. EkiNYC01]OKH36508.1 hypothetical protein FACHB389_11115 [Nostoc calcicola FACHB-389]
MNTSFLRKGVFWLPSIATLTVLSSGLSAIAQTVDAVNTQPLTESPAAVVSGNELSTEPEVTETTEPSTVANVTRIDRLPNGVAETLTPIPGTVATSSAKLISEPVEPNSGSISQPSAPKVAQSDIDLGTTTRGGSSYVGVAGNIGLSGGDSSLGDGNFAVISKVGLTSAISVRPSAIIGDNTTVLLPVTYDFSFKPADVFSEPLGIAPYVGVGAAWKTGDDSQFAFLISGGVDVPLSSQFTATASVNAGFFDQTDVGLLLGVGYNFNGF